MNTQHISNLLSCMPNVQVCASNELHFDKMPFYAVVNSEDSNSDGLHWLALAFFVRDERVECNYFDSLGGGMLTMVPNIKNFIWRHADVLYLNSNRIQSLSSSVCGLYSTYFIICMQNKIKFQDFLLQFSSDVNFNDQSVFKLFYSALKNLAKVNNESKVLACRALI